AAVMSGRHAGVQTILRENYMTRAIYIHCFVHKLNLVICDVSKVVPYLSEFYSIVSKIYTYFNASSVTNECFKNIQQQLLTENNNIPTSLKKWSNIRWDSRWSSVNALIGNYKSLLLSLEELENENDERSVDARGLLLALKVPKFIVTLFIVHKIFGIIRILSDQLKAKTMDFHKAQCLIKSVINQIADLRDEHAFSFIYQQITTFCTEHHIDLSSTPRPIRNKKVSSRFKDVIINSTIGQRDYLNNEDDYRENLFHLTIDAVLIELNDRFSVHNLAVLAGMSALCPDSDTFLQINILKAFAVQMKADFSSLSNEMQVIKPMIKDTNTKLENIIDFYSYLLPLKQAFPIIISLIIAAMTIPVSSTTCERTFSKMKLIKTITRNTMSDNRLSDLCVLAVERDFVVDFEKLIDDFADLHKNSRILLK
ncbi:unnamed protein product, partial [Adineta ricciae]